LQLSYVNAYTALPTIDLNNEILEDLGGTTLTPNVSPIANRQTTLDDSELELQFEYENAGVYSGFLDDGSLIWPWRFPFDLNHAKRRIYLDGIGLSREQVVRLAATAPTIESLAEAALDLNSAQRARISSSTVDPLSSTYN